MATAHLGTLKEFNPAEESISSYLERVQLFFMANEVDARRQVPTFLSIIGPTTYVTLRDLFAPILRSEKSLDEIFQCLRHHFEPKRAITVERFYFHKHNQTGGESIAEFDAALRKLATHCGFAGYLEEALGDRFVCGLRDEAIQRRLLSEKNLTLAKAMDLTLSMEAAEKNSRSVRREDAPSINTVQGPTRPKFGSDTRSKPAPDAEEATIPQRTANSRKLRPHVGRKATSHQPAVLSLQQSRQSLRGDAQANHIELMWCSKKLRLPRTKKDSTCSSCRHQPPQPPLRPSK